ncbi:MAG: CDP-glycerol glycerophosphotransferase family protein [Propionibacteriales bacterium]|nr:CDP-glycerol glycerophosphotransferase family protein [Propionibacteriales bacterium]
MTAPEILAYFADDATRAYQLIQWLPVLERLDETRPVAIVSREPETAALIRSRTFLPVHEAVDFPDLIALYADLDAKVVLYCNNGMRNFQSLLNNKMLHVHINHGESDKQSMVSNNAKAYDRVFVAGEAAVLRHSLGLIGFDTDKLVRVGRPQLDLRPEPVLDPSDRRTVLYAPTWSGDAEYNDYTSVDVFGPEIVEQVLAVPNVRLVYKPHPKVTTSLLPAIQVNHATILRLIAEATAHDPAAGHRAICRGDILAVFPGCDAMITDVSSVGLDWLYLQTDKPLLITDRYDDPERLRTEVPVSRCADTVDSTNLEELRSLLVDRLEHDQHRIARAAMRHHYFDDLGVGDSTRQFIAEVDDLALLRDELIGAGGPGSHAETA